MGQIAEIKIHLAKDQLGIARTNVLAKGIDVPIIRTHQHKISVSDSESDFPSMI
jgi:hypothetical protein